MKVFAALLTLALAVAAAAPAGAADFPVSVQHAFGETTIPGQPKRIVSAGYVEQDFLYALGIAPVGVREWFGGKPFASWPWADAARETVHAKPAVLNGDGINLEWVLEQNPDLILAVYQDIDQPTYEALSKIAPTVAMPRDYPTWGAPWQEELKLIDAATSGSTQKAEKIIADLGAKLAAVQAAYPQFRGKTATNVYADAGAFYAYGPEDTASRFILSLGFAFPGNWPKGDADYNKIEISAENMRLLDLDTVIWPVNPGETTQATVEAMPLYRNLRLAREGRSLWLDDGQGTFSAALSFSSPLSIAYLLDKLPPMLAATVDGDPLTRPVVSP